MKSILIIGAISIVFIASVTAPALAQTQPANAYGYSNLISGIRFAPPSSYAADDFAWSMVNPMASSIKVNATLTKINPSTGLEDPTFQFAECTQKGHYVYPGGWILEKINDPLENLVSVYAPNVLGISVLASGPEFQGTLYVNADPNQDFYIFPATSFTAASPTFESDVCSAYKSAWQSGSWTMPWFWDGTASRLITPYVNFWHNDTYWTSGWNTSLSIYNPGTQSIQATLSYLSSLNQGQPVSNAPGACSTNVNLNETATVTVGAGTTWSGNLRDTILMPISTYRVGEDGFIWITLNPILSGTTPSSSLTGLTGGTATCGVSPCPLITTCR